MIPASDVTTRELSAARLRLADGLTFTPFFRQGRAMYRVATAAQKTFFEVGREEGVFLSLLDGRTSVAEAISLMARILGPTAIKEHDAVAVSRWLLDSGLATSADAPASLSSESSSPVAPSESSGSFNPLWFRIPLIRSDAWLDRLFGAVGWVHSVPAAFAWIAVVLLGGLQLLSDWPRFCASAGHLWIPDDWLWTALLWCVLKVGHELSHALACRKYGGRVHEMGITMILFAPVAYVDVSSSWGFLSRRRRMHVAIAGVYADLLTAAIAAFVWARTDSVVLQHVLSRTIWLCTLTTLLFNLNPLVRSDGYYLLCDACDIPNLSALSRSAVGQLVRRLFFGAAAMGNAERPRPLHLAYGLAAMAWSAMTMSAFLIGAAAWFHGLGILIAAVGALLWIGPSLARIFSTAQRTLRQQPRSSARFATVSVCCALAAATLFLAPWPGGGTAPYVVDFADPAVVRADGPGFVRSVHANDGETVAAGDLLLELHNADLEAERREVAADLDGKEALRRTKLNDGDAAGAQVAAREAESLRTRLDKLERQLRAMEVRAPTSGRVIGRNLPQLAGTWCELGQVLLTIAPDDSRELRASIPQDDADLLRSSVGETFAARFPARGRANVVLERIAPRGSVEPLHPALVVPLGGPLAARPIEKSAESGEKFELLEPCFCATLRVDDVMSRQVIVGETGFVDLGRQKTVFAVLESRLRKWLRHSGASAPLGI